MAQVPYRERETYIWFRFSLPLDDYRRYYEGKPWERQTDRAINLIWMRGFGEHYPGMRFLIQAGPFLYNGKMEWQILFYWPRRLQNLNHIANWAKNEWDHILWTQLGIAVGPQLYAHEAVWHTAQRVYNGLRWKPHARTGGPVPPQFLIPRYEDDSDDNDQGQRNRWVKHIKRRKTFH